MWATIKKNKDDDDLVTKVLFPTRRQRLFLLGCLIILAALFFTAIIVKDESWSLVFGLLGIAGFILWLIYWVGTAKKYILNNETSKHLKE